MQLSFEDRTYLVTGGGSGIGKGVAAGLVACRGLGHDRRPQRRPARRGRRGDRRGQGRRRRDPLRARRRHQRGRGHPRRRGRDGLARPAARRGALRRRIADHRPAHPDRLRRRGGAPSTSTSTAPCTCSSTAPARWCAAAAGRSSASRRSPPATPTAGSAPTASPRSALDHLMQLAADELGASWVRVNSIRPGLIRTDMVAPITDSPELSRGLPALHPAAAGRRGRGHRQHGDVSAQRCRQLGHRAGHQRRRRASCCAAARTSARCWNRCSAPTACAESVVNRPLIEMVILRSRRHAEG